MIKVGEQLYPLVYLIVSFEIAAFVVPAEAGGIDGCIGGIDVSQPCRKLEFAECPICTKIKCVRSVSSPAVRELTGHAELIREFPRGIKPHNALVACNGLLLAWGISYSDGGSGCDQTCKQKIVQRVVYCIVCQRYL